MLGERCESRGDAFGVLVNKGIFEGVWCVLIEENVEYLLDMAWEMCIMD